MNAGGLNKSIANDYRLDYITMKVLRDKASNIFKKDLYYRDLVLKHDKYHSYILEIDVIKSIFHIYKLLPYTLQINTKLSIDRDKTYLTISESIAPYEQRTAQYFNIRYHIYENNYSKIRRIIQYIEKDIY